MKKFLYTTITAMTLMVTANAQDKQADFDKKNRFGLRAALQPCWFTSNDNNNPPYGAALGSGFGLTWERKFSSIVALSTGIGADFEGGKYTFRSDPSNNYQVNYWQDNGGSFVEPKKDISQMSDNTYTRYILKERSIKTTHVTIPVMLKLSTNEYSGFKYFGMFGGEVGIRIKNVATDSYLTSYKFQNGVTTSGIDGEGASSQANINLGKDGSLIPLRVGFNAGIGTEYRLGGSTSLFMSVNYFRSFTNLLRNESKYMIYNVDLSDPTNAKYNFVKQNLIQNAIRINIGVLF
jgi:hypothetical protein